jgi:hypothetical protein
VLLIAPSPGRDKVEYTGWAGDRQVITRQRKNAPKLGKTLKRYNK